MSFSLGEGRSGVKGTSLNIVPSFHVQHYDNRSSSMCFVKSLLPLTTFENIVNMILEFNIWIKHPIDNKVEQLYNNCHLPRPKLNNQIIAAAWHQTFWGNNQTSSGVNTTPVHSSHSSSTTHTIHLPSPFSIGHLKNLIKIKSGPQN
eukprot:780527-Amphidinium_carterae.1